MLESSHHLKNKNSFLYSNKFDSFCFFFIQHQGKKKPLNLFKLDFPTHKLGVIIFSSG
jgi:hypothetical protein